MLMGLISSRGATVVDTWQIDFIKMMTPRHVLLMSISLLCLVLFQDGTAIDVRASVGLLIGFPTFVPEFIIIFCISAGIDGCRRSRPDSVPPTRDQLLHAQRVKFDCRGFAR